MADASWAVYTQWQECGPVSETSETHRDWRAARRAALSYACLRGVRYVSVQDADDVVVGEYDRYTNRWREYARPEGTTDG